MPYILPRPYYSIACLMFLCNSNGSGHPLCHKTVSQGSSLLQESPMQIPGLSGAAASSFQFFLFQVEEDSDQGYLMIWLLKI